MNTTMLETINNLATNPTAIVLAVGYIGVFAIIFAESGILAGIFLPGDSLLFASGIISASGFLHPAPLIALVIVAAITGDSTGYWLGYYSGEALLRRYPRLIKPKYIIRTERFFERFGTRTIILARFVPIVRTIAPPLSGISKMPYATFFRANIIGAMLWGPLIIGLGYFLGRTLPGIEHYLLPISIGIITLSFIPFFIRMFLRKKKPVQNNELSTPNKD